MKKHTILIIDDHTLLRQILSKSLSQDGQFDVIGNTGDAEEAIELAMHFKPDIVLLDLNINLAGSFLILGKLRKHVPGIKVLGLSTHLEPAYAKKLIKAGGRGYLTTKATEQELTQAIVEVLKGNIYICKEVKTRLSNQLLASDQPSKTDLPHLSARELEIVALLKDGLSSRQIGEALFINSKTVEVHRHNILKKVSVKNTAALIHYLNKHGSR